MRDEHTPDPAAPWIDLTDLGAVPDDLATLTATLVEAASGADLVISTGGVSVGDEDHMPSLFREGGAETSTPCASP